MENEAELHNVKEAFKYLIPTDPKKNLNDWSFSPTAC